MLRIIVYGISSIFTLCLQASYLKFIEIRGVTPNIVIAFIVSYSIIRGKKEGAILAVFIGIIHDIMFGKVIGCYSLIYFYIGYFSGYFNKHFYEDNYLLSILMIALCDFIYGVYVYFFTFLFRGRLNISFYFFEIIIPEVVFTTVFSLLIYKFVLIINAKVIKKEQFYKPRLK